ncbi:prepilin-type N-terminal cleavage/methylation domain-containing protein [Oxalobacteraceae bacterium A2-2]
MCIEPFPRQRGLSLIELIIFMVVMGVAAAAVLQVMNLATRNSADPVRRKQALLIAEAYMEEIQMARFTYCDPIDPNAMNAQAADAINCPAALEQLGTPGAESGNTRPYDNVNDYAGKSLANASGVLLDASGAVLGGGALAGYTVTVSVDAPPGNRPLGPAGRAITGTTLPASMNILLITVRVAYGGGANDFVALDGYRTRYAPRSVP